MSAVVHFVVFAEDGVIKSDAGLSMPGADKNLAQGQTGVQRFACGPERSKLWAMKDAAGVLHVASGEFVRVTCEECKATKEYRDASGIVNPVHPLPVPPSLQASQQRTSEPARTESVVEPARQNESLAAV